jgi:NADPH:quinone reductase-like Zn-dependent oxidoreductase
MKAFIYEKYGPPEVLQLKEVDKPVPKDNEILVKVRATSVNRTDCANLRAKPDIMRLSMGLFKPKNPILGTEFAGDVEAIGSEVTRFKVEDRVFGFGDYGIRSYAEYLVFPENRGVDTIPDSYSYAEAACTIEGAHYAYNFINKFNLKAGDKILVNGACGSIGSAAVQLLKHLDIQITAVCKTEDLHVVKSLGAKKVFDYTKEDFTKDTEKYDYVFDTAGKTTFGRIKHMLQPGGAYISSELGPWWQNAWFALITALWGSMPGNSGKKVKFPYPPDILRSIKFVIPLIENGEYKAVIDRKYPFEEIPDAFRYVEKGNKTGNVSIVLT